MVLHRTPRPERTLQQMLEAGVAQSPRPQSWILTLHILLVGFSVLQNEPLPIVSLTHHSLIMPGTVEGRKWPRFKRVKLGYGCRMVLA